MRILYSLLLSALFCLSLNAQTVWTGDVDSDWMNAANWSAGVPTSGMTVTIPGTPNGGIFPIYSGSPVIDLTIQNAGSITFNDFVYNNGTIINFNIGTLVNNNNYFVNAGSVVFDNDGSFTNTGTFENFGTFDNAASATFTNDNGASLINHGQFTNNGLLENDGTFTNYGAIMSTNNVVNSGTILNHGTFASPNGSAITNAAGGNIDILTGGSFSHNDDFQNDGTVTNNGTLTTENSGTLTNDGTITTQNDFQLSGTLLNNSLVTNDGSMTINNSGTLNNTNNFANNGTVNTEICGIIIQDSPTDIAATVLHDGIIYELQGNVDETILEFGVVYNDINQTKPPVPGCKSGYVLVLDENGLGTLTVADVDKGGYGECGATLVDKTINRTDFTIADLGSQLVTLTVEDNFGFTASCDAVITVVEYVEPLVAVDDPDIEFACPTDITVTPEAGQSLIPVSWDEPADPTTTCTVGNEETCATRTASNTTQCNNSTVYGMYLTFNNLNNHYTVANGVFIEYEDGTANYTATITNVSNSDYVFDIDFQLSGRTVDPPSGSPKDNSCISTNEDDWYYYTTSDGTLTGVAGLAGASVSMSRIGPAFQLGNGANATDGTNQFGASGWLSGVVNNQPTNGPDLVFSGASGGQDGDINIMLSGDGNECQQVTQCSDVSENIPGFIYLGEFNDAKYFISDHPSNWVDARSNTEANGGHLVSINSVEENNYIHSNINPGTGSVWTGLTTINSPGDFQWINGDPLTYTNWQVGEPGGSIYDKATRLKKSTGEWTDRNIYNYSYEYVMEIPCSNGGDNGSCEDVVLDITFDNYPEDVSWEIKDANNTVVASGGNYGSQPNGSSISITTCLTDGCYDFIVSDSYGDGICCQYGNGSYTLTGADGTVYGTGGDYGNGETVNFCVTIEDGGGEPADPVVEQIGGPANGADFFVGVTEVIYRVTDDCGNEEICIFTVTVEDNPAEITADCPADVVVDAAPGASSAIATWADPTATTTCYIPGIKVAQIDSTYFSGDALPVGTTFIPYNLVDSCNNFTQCLLTVTVNGQVAVLTLDSCPGDITTDSDNFTWDVPTASTTCFTGNVEIEQVEGPAIGSNPADGTYEIVYLINDDCGNSEVCVFDVTVAASCPASGTACDDGDACTTNDVEDGDCGCAGTFTDSDGDGVCDADDICEGGDDNVDTDGDGTPDFCDDCSTAGQPCDDGDACTTGDVYDADCNCAGTYTDSDGDGVCDADDICEGGDDNMDSDGDGTPDACDDCSTVGQPCDDGDACTTGDVYDAACNCVGTLTDSDGDGVCDADDICEGGDDNVDTDGDGTPDFCDDCSTVGQPCNDGDACTTGDVYDANCNCIGSFADADADGVCDADDVCEGGDDNMDTDGDGTPDFCDDDEPSDNPCDDVVITSSQGNITVSNINAPIFNVFVFNSGWGTEYNCNYSCTDPTSVDLAPGTYYVKVSLRDASWDEICEIFETVIVTEGCAFNEGDPCNDGDACTTGDVYDADCNCAGTLTDSDGDGVCDADDVCEGFDDNADADADGIPDGCDTNECDNVTYGGLVSGDETSCTSFDPAEITVQAAPSGGSGNIEYIWLASTTGCPSDTLLAIPGATGATYDPGVITETTYYLRCSRRADCTVWAGESNCIVKTVDATDTDGDGVCDLEDICEGGDDNADNDGDGIPNFCDDTPDGGGDPCENIQLSTGPGSITVSNIDAPIFNIFVFTSGWSTEYNCNYNCIDPTTIDVAPGTYYVKVSLRDANWNEICEIFETVVVTEGCSFDPGTPCDDGDACTTGDVYDEDCNCAGTFEDSDNDGVCNAEDVCDGYDDNADDDGDGIPNGCDSNVCENVTDGGAIAGDESGCSGYDPAMITVESAPSGGAGNIEYLWLSSTTGCPTSLTQEIPGATSATYDPGTITETTYFVRCSRRSDCDDWTQGESNCVVKTVNTADLDGDGVCDLEDICAGGDDNADNDGDGTPNHCDDTPDGGGDPCENVNIVLGDGSITVSNLDAPIFTIMVFDAGWNTVYNCGYTCTDPALIDGLSNGDYHVSVKLYDENWNQICNVTPTVTVTGGSGYAVGDEVFDFRAQKNGREVRTYWMTNTESKNDHFIVERSADGINFETINNVNSITASNGAFNYFESDLEPFLGENFYRLTKVHTDGSEELSVVRRVVFDLDLSATAVFPNPATNEVYIDLQDFEGRSATISIFNHLGQRMDFKAFDAIQPSPIRFDLTRYTGGAYTIYINMDGTKNFARKFIVSKL